MKTAKLILLCLSGMLAMQSATAQSRSEKKAQTERNVREAINADHYKINVDYMQPMKGRSRALTSDYSIEIRNDSVFSYLPYFGVAYNVPYGGGKGLIFNAPITGYRKESLKKGKTRIDFHSLLPVGLLSFYKTGPPRQILPLNRNSISAKVFGKGGMFLRK